MFAQPFFMGMRQTAHRSSVTPIIDDYLIAGVKDILTACDQFFIDMQKGFLYTPVTSEFLLF